MCKIVALLFRFVRWTRFRDCLIRKHLAACPDCGAEALDAGGWAELVRPPEWIAGEDSLWPEVEKRMKRPGRNALSPEPARALRPFTSLAAAAGGVLAVAVLAVLLWRFPRRGFVIPAGSALEAQAPRVEVLSAEILGRGARSSVYQTKNASFIWFYPSPRKEGS